jgi:hypothetical protein
MSQEIIGHILPLLAQHSDGAFKIDRVPKDYGGYNEIESTCPAFLTFLGSVSKFAQAVEKHCTRKSVAGLSLV